MSKISEVLTSGEAVDALEAAIRATPEGSAALDVAVADIIAARDLPKA